MRMGLWPVLGDLCETITQGSWDFPYFPGLDKRVQGRDIMGRMRVVNWTVTDPGLGAWTTHGLWFQPRHSFFLCA